MWDDLTHLIALTIDRSDWIISEISRGKRPYSPVPFLKEVSIFKWRTVPGDWCGRFRGRLFLTDRPFRFLARLKAFNGGLLKILLVLLSSQRIRKFLEIIFLTRLLGRKVVRKGTLSLAMLLAATLFKISALDLVDACSLPLLMRSFRYPHAARKISIFAASMSKSASSLQILRSLRNWL